jgi:dihydroorotate dehydrogenase electron transfer subunit
MSQPATTAQYRSCPIVEHVQEARDTYRVRLHVPEIAAQFLPGQFVMARIAECDDPLIGRALAIFDRQTDGHHAGGSTIDLVYVVKGKFTRMLARQKEGQKLDLVGPLGNAFSNQPTDHLILVAGGVGETPMLSLAREALGRDRYGIPGRSNAYSRRVTLCYGARTKDLLACVPAFQATGIDVRLSTDDGSLGLKQRVTVTLEQVLDQVPECSQRIVCCGPEPMMEATSAIARARQIPCEVSLETPMACGIGICFTCVAKIRQGDHWDYRRTCVEGPIFNSADVVW